LLTHSSDAHTHTRERGGTPSVDQLTTTLRADQPTSERGTLRVAALAARHHQCRAECGLFEAG